MNPEASNPRHQPRRNGATAMRPPSIAIVGPDRHGMYVIEMRNGAGRTIALFVPESEGGDVLGPIQERMPYGLVLSDPADVPTVR